MENTIAVYKVRDKNLKHSFGFVWIKKRSSSKIMDAVVKKLREGQVLLNIWVSNNWKQHDYTYEREYPRSEVGASIPEYDPIPNLKSDSKMKPRIKIKNPPVIVAPVKPVYVPTSYKLARAPLKD